MATDVNRSAGLVIDLPAWVDDVVGTSAMYPSDDERMALVITLARENVVRDNGGPFGAAIFEEQTGSVVAVGINLVQQLNNCVLHAEILALMFAQRRLGVESLFREGEPTLTLYTSCDPCAMCLGAVLWSGVRRVVCGATRDDAIAIGFDEGPVFPESLQYLSQRGITVSHGVRRNEAADVLRLYAARQGVIYNGTRGTTPEPDGELL